MRRGGGGLAAVLLSLSVLAQAEQTTYGSGGSGVWSLGAGTRALALGSTAGLLAQDASVITHNPAALALMRNGEAGFHHGLWDAGVAWDQAAAVLPLGSSNALGFSGALASYGSFERTNDLGDSTGSYEASEALSALAYAHRFGDLALGGSGLMTRQTIDKDVLFGYAWAGGAVWKPLSYLSMASAVRAATEGYAGGSFEGDLGMALHSRGDAGRTWNLGVNSHYAGEGRSELQFAGSRGFQGSGGVDGQILGGYKLGFADELHRGNSSSWSLGASLGWQAWALDYAFMPMGDIESSHHLGLRYRFKGPEPMAVAEAPSLGPPPPVAPEPLNITATPPPIVLPSPAEPMVVSPPAQSSTVVTVLSDGVVRGMMLETEGKAREALEAYAEAVRVDGKDLAAWKQMAKLYDRLKRPDLGLRCWAVVAQLDPADPEAAAALKAPEIPAVVVP